jgi:hypothetical protein
MTKEEFQKYVIAEAQKYLFTTEDKVPADSLKVIKENVTIKTEKISPINPSDILRLAEEIKKINKKIDLRNPLISESNESLVESILKENQSSVIERHLDVDGINKKKHISFQNEAEKDKWNRMLNYNIPDDEKRS